MACEFVASAGVDDFVARCDFVACKFVAGAGVDGLLACVGDDL